MTCANNSIQEKAKLLQLYTDFINTFDGNSDAFIRAEPIMDELFDATFTFVTDDGPKDLKWYRNFAKSFAEVNGNVAKVTDIKSTQNGIQVTINNTIAGVELDPITYNGTAVADENGKHKISYFEPVTQSKNNHVENVGKMIQLVGNGGATEYSDETITFVCKMAIKSNKIDEFKDRARKAVSEMKFTEKEGRSSFDIYFSNDDSRCHTVEIYTDSNAAANHIRNMRTNEHRNAAISKYSMISVLEVYGQPSEELEDILSEEEYDVEYYGQAEVSL